MAVGDVIVRFEPHGAALELFNDKTSREICLSGAAGTGKTVAALMLLHLSCLGTPGVRALIVRKTHASLTASTLVTFRRMAAAEAIAAGLVRFYGGSAQEAASFRYQNGSVITVAGLDKPSRLLSMDLDLVFVDEAVETTAEDLDTIISRLRNGVLSRQQLILATNPGPPSHHLKARADSGRCRMLYSKHEDNPRMFQAGEWTPYGLDYLARLDSLTGVRYERLRHGRWVSAEGAVYAWDPEIHLIDKFPIPAGWTRYMAVDFGHTNPMAVQWWAEDGDGRLYLYREIFKTGVLVEDHARKILSIVAPGGKWIEPRPRAIVCDHDAEGRATLERHLGMSTVAAKKDVLEGIEAVKARLKVQPDGRPRLMICRDALVERDRSLVEASRPYCTELEFPEYVWDSRPVPGGGSLREAPVKESDHGLDAARYLVAQLDLIGRPGYRSFDGRGIPRRRRIISA